MPTTGGLDIAGFTTAADPLLSDAVDRVLDDLAHDLVLSDCRLRSAAFPPDLAQERFAATERGSVFEQNTLASEGLSVSASREGGYTGQVTDGTAHYRMGDVSDNAGLFATADELGRRGQMWLQAGPLARQSVISPASTRRATANRWPQTEPARGLGGVVRESTAPVRDGDAAVRGGFHPPTESPCGPRFSGELLSSHAFGQTGFTGMSLWIDPAADVVAVPAAAQPARRVPAGRGFR